MSDSFRTASKAYFLQDFHQSLVLHRNYLDESMAIDFTKQLKKGDAIIILAVERYDYQNVDVAKKLTELLQEGT